MTGERFISHHARELNGWTVCVISSSPHTLWNLNFSPSLLSYERKCVISLQDDMTLGKSQKDKTGKRWKRERKEVKDKRMMQCSVNSVHITHTLLKSV